MIRTHFAKHSPRDLLPVLSQPFQFRHSALTPSEFKAFQAFSKRVNRLCENERVKNGFEGEWGIVRDSSVEILVSRF